MRDKEEQVRRRQNYVQSPCGRKGLRVQENEKKKKRASYSWWIDTSLDSAHTRNRRALYWFLSATYTLGPSLLLGFEIIRTHLTFTHCSPTFTLLLYPSVFCSNRQIPSLSVPHPYVYPIHDGGTSHLEDKSINSESSSQVTTITWPWANYFTFLCFRLAICKNGIENIFQLIRPF